MAEKNDFKEFIETPNIFENCDSIIRRDFIVKTYIHGNPFINRPHKTKIVSYVDAESSMSGVYENDEGIVTQFVCDRCKKTFKADKARAIKIYLSEACFGEDGTIFGYEYQRAFCGRCFKTTRQMTKKIFEAITEFDNKITEFDNKERIET